MLNNITRLELINHSKIKHAIGRLISLYKSEKDFNSVYFSIQDNGRTLKIFISNDEVRRNFTSEDDTHIDEVVTQYYEENLIGKFTDEQSEYIQDILKDFAKHYILL